VPGIKIADKAQMAAKKKNLEGNNIAFQNSFVVFDNIILADKFHKMGGTENINLEYFDLLEDMEVARHNLKERAKSLTEASNVGTTENLPSEEMKYIEWKSESSEHSDEEGFQLVPKRRKKKSPKHKDSPTFRKSKGYLPHPFDGSNSLDGEISRVNSRYYLRKGNTIKNKG
jgi:hypothetical protein